MPTQPIARPDTRLTPSSPWAIHVHSIGQSGVSLVKALKQISPLSEQKIASMLYQAPTRLFTDLPEQSAKEIERLLREAGLDCAAVVNELPLETGDDQHEIALVIKDVSRMTEVAELIMNLIGADLPTVRQMLFTTPTVLLGKISNNTALIIRDRFAELGVEVDISVPAQAQFDVFLGSCTELELHQLKKILSDLSLPVAEEALEANTLLLAGLSRTQADAIWDKVCRTALPLRIVNRDFERFDVQLEAMPGTSAAEAYLTDSTGMPPQIAKKVLAQLPVVIHQYITFSELEATLARITELGGKATGNLLVFQTFSLQIESFTDKQKTLDLLTVLGKQERPHYEAALTGDQLIAGPFTSLQARWLQHELKRVGTSAKRLLR